MRLQNDANNIIEAPDPSEHKYSKLKVKELKELCISRGLPAKGVKQVILDALLKDDALIAGGSIYDASLGVGVAGVSVGGEVSGSVSEEMKKMGTGDVDEGSVKSLKEESTSVSTSSDSDNSAASIYATMSDEHLREVCLSKCLSPSGDRSELLETLLGDIQADESVSAPISEMSFVRRYAEGLRADAPIYAMDPAVKKYKEIR